MAGCLIPHTPIAVDCWKKRDAQAKIHFLSHMHGDHTEGLTSSWNQTIYCSEITRSLVIEKFSIDPSLLVAIPIGQSTIIALDDAGVENMTVTLIDANHCPGAVMFLFQGYFGCILHTGDFRYFDGMLDISPFTNDIVINTLYLDNTYCDPKCEFPSRTEAAQMVLDIIRNNQDKDIVFGLNNLGKEELLYEVAKDQDVPIVVDQFRKKTADLLGYGSFFTTDPEESHISVKPRRQVNKYSLKSLNNDVPTIGIIPSCLHLDKDNLQKTNTIFVVPYSDHSCFSELKNFVAKVKPQRIIPVVNESSTAAADSHNRADMSIFAGEKLFGSEEHVFDVPSTVLAFMSRNQNERKVFGGRKRKAATSYFNGRAKRACGIVFSPKKQASEDNNEMLVEHGVPVPDEKQIDRAMNLAPISSSSIAVDPFLQNQRVSKKNEEIIAPPMLAVDTAVQSDRAAKQREEAIDSPTVAVDPNMQNEHASKQSEEIKDSPMVAVDSDVQNERANKQSEEIIVPPMVAVDSDVQNERANKQSEEIKDSLMVAVDSDVQNERANKQSKEIIVPPMVGVDSDVQNERTNKQSKEIIVPPMVGVDSDVQNERTNKQSKEIIVPPMVAVDSDVQNERTNKQSKEIIVPPMVAVDSDVQNERTNKQSKDIIVPPMVAVDTGVQNQLASKKSEEMVAPAMVAVDSDVQKERVSKQSHETIDSPMVAVYPDVQNERISEQNEEIKGSPIVAVDPDTQNERARGEREEITALPMVVVDTRVRNEFANKQSEDTMNSPVVAVDPDIQEERASKQSEEIKDSPIVAVNADVQNELANKQSKETVDLPMVAVDRDIQNERVDKQSDKIIAPPMVTVNTDVQSTLARKHSEGTPRNEDDEQHAGENVVLSTQEGSGAPSRTSDRENANVLVLKRKRQRKCIYTGDVSFARQVLKDFMREIFSKSQDSPSTDV